MNAYSSSIAVKGKAENIIEIDENKPKK